MHKDTIRAECINTLRMGQSLPICEGMDFSLTQTSGFFSIFSLSVPPRVICSFLRSTMEDSEGMLPEQVVIILPLGSDRHLKTPRFMFIQVF